MTSISEFCFRLAENNPMISWNFKKTEFSCFVNMWNGSEEALYLGALLRTIMELESLKNPITIHYDNQSHIVLAKNTFNKDQNILK